VVDFGYGAFWCTSQPTAAGISFAYLTDVTRRHIMRASFHLSQSCFSVSRSFWAGQVSLIFLYNRVLGDAFIIMESLSTLISYLVSHQF
jgi:hypothetical protein